MSLTWRKRKKRDEVFGSSSNLLKFGFGVGDGVGRRAIDGKAPPQIADIVGVSANTLKSQLASIYRKTGTSRQAQIARLVLQLGIVAGEPEQSLTRSSSQV
jgi:Bacterial regulatory proteins, luxR family